SRITLLCYVLIPLQRHTIWTAYSFPRLKKILIFFGFASLKIWSLEYFEMPDFKVGSVEQFNAAITRPVRTSFQYESSRQLSHIIHLNMIFYFSIYKSYFSKIYLFTSFSLFFPRAFTHEMGLVKGLGIVNMHDWVVPQRTAMYQS
ncbi:hypothetical protein ACJX0J_014966, partial [Zea mays]